MNDEWITDVKTTNRIESCDWINIEGVGGETYLQFLRDKVTFYTDYKETDENGNPVFWAVIDWIEENATDLWYMQDDCLFFYSDVDITAFKLRWS